MYTAATSSLVRNHFLGIVSLFAALLMVSCAGNREGWPESSAVGRSSLCGEVIGAIDRGDWESLRRLARPGMRADEYIMMWENMQKSGHAIHVGRQLRVDRDVELNGQKCTKYSYALVNEDGTKSPHQLQILVGKEDGKPELLDFWNFGW